MNDNHNLLTHIRTDQNAPTHLALGAMAGLTGLLTAWCLAPLLLGLTLGAAIEVWQRLRGGRNTLRESVMDAATTALPGAVLSACAGVFG